MKRLTKYNSYEGDIIMKRRQLFTFVLIIAVVLFSFCDCGSTNVEEPPANQEVEDTRNDEIKEDSIDDVDSGTDKQTEEQDEGVEDIIDESESSLEEQEEVPENLKVEINEKLLKKYTHDDKEGFFSPDYSALTDIVFSEGNSEDWHYSHNQREFEIKKCYSRIYTTAITKHFWGKENEINVYFIFTGANKCDIESTKGVVDLVKSDDSNVIVFKKTLYAAKKKKAETVLSEFKIVPKEACGLRIDVVYDASVPRKNDDSSTIYFTKE